MMNKILIKNGRVIDPASDRDDNFDVLIHGNLIEQIAVDIKADDAEIIDASDCIVLPGLIDMHVHFREPGREEAETIAGGARTAAKSGFTTVCIMPNTNPNIDSPEMIEFIKSRTEGLPVNVLPIANITKNAKGIELTDMAAVAANGAIGFSDDGMPVMNAYVMRKALEAAAEIDIPIITHSEDLNLVNGGVINEGAVSNFLGLKGIPNETEEVIISRDAILARMTGGRVHVAHVSTAGSVEIIQNAKSNGISITCEATPHHFSLNEEAVRTHGSMAKMNPPLRSEEDRQIIIEGLRSGIIDVIATDHAPHTAEDKAKGIEKAPFGIIGLETAVPLIITHLVKENNFTYINVFKKLTVNPADILKIDKGRLQEGKIADITIIDPLKKVIIDEKFIVSKSRNTPFMGQELYGSVEYTICNGEIVYRNDQK